MQINLEVLTQSGTGQGMTDHQPWVPGRIPLPGVTCMGVVAEAVPEVDDLFSKAVVVKYFENQSYGFVRDHLNRELFFHVDELDFCGEKNNKKYIHVGAKVGFDISRTSHGLRVRRMKIY